MIKGLLAALKQRNPRGLLIRTNYKPARARARADRATRNRPRGFSKLPTRVVLLRQRADLRAHLSEARDDLAALYGKLGARDFDGALDEIQALSGRAHDLIGQIGYERVTASQQLNAVLGGVNSWPQMLQRVAVLADAARKASK